MIRDRPDNPRVTRCPTCGRRFDVSTGHSHLPFCSERCQFVDLGAWLNESRRISEESTADQQTPENVVPSSTVKH
ncbi:MAG TPA: DNA gyrase inhibitor YacG [Gammaproteobacteria bacterium]|nr:DNA gyrase inhibitor YacG [Gammaproteobacteria bacterium]